MSQVTSQFLLHSSQTLLCSTKTYPHNSLITLRRSSRTMLKAPLTSSGYSTEIHTARRSADYPTTAWDYDFLESLPTQDFEMEKYGEERKKMIAEVKQMLDDSSMDALSRLELVDAIDRLGLKRHFQDEIKANVEIVYRGDSSKGDEDLHATSLRFRVLRQHGYAISEDILNKFKDQEGKICKDFTKDIRGLLSLYEASYLEYTTDETLAEIRDFSAQHLKELLNTLPPKWAKLARQALDLPLHWRFPRLKARWSIEACDDLLHPCLIRLAKLDYNIVQSGYKEDIIRLVRWWKEVELLKKIPYTRDRLLEHCLWTVSFVEDPEYRHYREMETKIINLMSSLDDTYDIYGTLEELEIFTDLINKWEINGIDQLPEPMRQCYLAIYNTSNDIADWVLREKGFDIVPYFRKSWARLCKDFLQEAKWYHEVYKPSLTEYLQRAIVTTTGPIMLLIVYFLTAPSISKEALDYIDSLPNLLCYGSTILRLLNDLGTSSDELARGDTLKALECYMNESGASVEIARDHIMGLVKESWKKMNEEYYLLRSQYPATISEPFLGANLNLARASHFFYSFEKDWHGKPDKEMMDHIMLLFIDPVPM